MKKIIPLFLIVAILPILAWAAKADMFSDVYTTHINKDAIEYLKTNNAIQGYSDGTFKPENRINRAEFIKMIVATQVAKPTGSNCFTDVKNEWFAPYVCTAKKLGYIQGYSDGTYKPGNYINFAEASKIVDKALAVKEVPVSGAPWFAPFVKGLEAEKAIPTTVQFIDKDVSRGEVAEILWRLKTNETAKVSATYEEITSTFPTMSSCAALKEKFDAYQAYNYYPYYRGGVMMEVMPSMSTAEKAAPEAGAPAPSAGAAANDYSQTNVQVAGVDEADVIKNDGQYIYMVKGNTVRIIQAYKPDGMTEVANLAFTDEGFHPQEMYISGNRLVIIGQAWQAYPGPIPMGTIMMPRYPFQGNRTKVYIYDVTDHAKPVEERVLAFDGDYNTSRRVDNNLFLVINDQPNVWIMSDVKSGEDLIPKMQDGTNDAKPMAGCMDIHYFPGFWAPRYMVVASVPLDDPKGEVDSEVMLGSSENVYSSQTHLYVAANAVNYDMYTDWNWQRDQAKTQIYNFALEDGKINFKSRGEVPGTILNQFSMDSYKNFFRIATTKGNTWDEANPSGNNVYVLDSDMKTVGKLEELAPGERIYSTRFLGDRVYMVTFKQVDPLFVIDLSNPREPKLLGKLKIPGFSEYLHPYDANHIIGFGKETFETDKGAVIPAGMKIALFNVTDVANPVQQFVETIGDNGTYSELLNNHKALLFDKDKNLLAFPIQIVEKVKPEDLQCNKYRYSTCPNFCQQRCIPTTCTQDSGGAAICTTDCEGLGSCTNPSYEQSETTFSGALVYTLNLTDGFKLRGRITHYTDAEILKMGSYWPYDYDKTIQRIIYIGEYLYTISQGMVKASTMDTVKDVKSLLLNQ